MKLYLDADIFLAVLKENDRFKKAAVEFFGNREQYQFVTGSLTCLEVWFYLHRNGLGKNALSSLRAIRAIAEILDYDSHDLEQAMILAETHNLTPADSIHAVLARVADAIVSTDSSFDKTGIRRIDFSKI